MENKVQDLLQRIRKGKSISSLNGKTLNLVLAELEGWEIEQVIYNEVMRHHYIDNDGKVLPVYDSSLLNVNRSAYATEERDYVDGEYVVVREKDLEYLASYREQVLALPKLEEAKKPKVNSIWVTNVGEIDDHGSFDIEYTKVVKGWKVTAPNGEELITDKNLYQLHRFAKDNGMFELINEVLGLPTVEVEQYEAKQAKLRDQSNMGTCGCCGGIYKLKANGTLVNHGFERPGIGFNIGKCEGQSYLPYEVSNEGAVAGKEAQEKQLEMVNAYLGRLNNGEITSLPMSVREGREVKEIQVLQGEEAWSNLLDAEIRKFEGAKNNIEYTIKWLEARINDWVQQPTLDEQREARKQAEA